MDNVEFTKIKLNKDFSVLLKYQVPKAENKFDQLSLNCSDHPLQSFNTAMLALRIHVLELCELPVNEININKVTVKSVSFNYVGEKHVMGCTICAVMKLSYSNTPLVLNTPYKIKEYYGEKGDEKALLSNECLSSLENLVEEAQKYLNGEREEIEMFQEDKE